MSLLPSARVNRRPMVWARMTKTPSAATRRRPERRAERGRDQQERQAADEQPDDPEPWPVREADQRVGGERAQDERDERAREPDDDRVDVRPKRVVAELDEDVAPGVEGRLEVDERDVERALVDLVRRLERGHDEPVDRQQDDERPAAQQQNAANLATGCMSTAIAGGTGCGRDAAGATGRRDGALTRAPYAASDEAHVCRGDEGHEDRGAGTRRPRSGRDSACSSRYRPGATSTGSRCPGPPPSRMLGMSMILKPSMRRMRTIVVSTGRMAGKVMLRSSGAAGAVDDGRLADLLVEAFEGGQQDDEHERGPLPRVADDHRHPGGPRVGHPREVAQAEPDPDRLERALRRVGHHQEHVADADRGDGQRDQEGDPEEASPGHGLDAQHRQPEAEQDLQAMPAEHEDQRHDERAGPAPVAREGPDEEPQEADEERRPPSVGAPGRTARTGRPGRPGRSDPDRPADADDEDGPAERRRGLEHAQEVALLGAEQELLVVREADER